MWQEKTVDNDWKYFGVNSLTMVRAGTAIGAALAASQGDVRSSILLLSIGAVSDLDGTFARKWDVASKEGAARDKLADLCWLYSFFLLAAIHIEHKER